MPSSSAPQSSADEASSPAAPARRLEGIVRFWPYFAISGLWVAIALLFAAQQSLSSPRQASQIVPRILLEWLPWIVFSPVIFAIATRFPPVKGRRVLSCTINLLATGVALAAAEYFFMVTTQPAVKLVGASTPASRRPPPPRFEDDFLPPPHPDDFHEHPFFDENRPLPPQRRLRDADAPPGGLGGPFRHLLQFHFPVALFVLMAAQANAAIIGLRERERRANELAASLAQAKLNALQSQLQPHFLFNALNALATVVHRDANQADEMINNLADLLRRSLAAGKRPEVTVGEELDHLACYLSIERVRFGDRLQVDWRIEDAARAALIPILALQPILENAVKHGVERRRETVGRIVIAASTEAGRLRITITDNGPGPDLDSSAAPAPVRPGHGIGLANTRARLHALHGDAASVSLEPAVGGGCRVTVSLPLRLSSEPGPTSATA